MSFIDVLLFGIFPLPWWGYIVVIFVLTHITILTVTIYCHRSMTHGALTLNPVVKHFFRFWLWITTAIITKEWVALHRLHHQKVDSEYDPHSPQNSNIGNVLLYGDRIYSEAIQDQEMVRRLSHDTPDDWLEKNVYSNKSNFFLIGINNWGLVNMLLCNLALFGLMGLLIWIVQMRWIPIFAAGVVNGLGHWPLKNFFKSESSFLYKFLSKFLLYRNTETKDHSANIIPWGFLIGGEELHNNHHANATSARLSLRWYEIDSGWIVIRLLQLLGLAKVRKKKI